MNTTETNNCKPSQSTQSRSTKFSAFGNCPHNKGSKYQQRYNWAYSDPGWHWHTRPLVVHHGARSSEEKEAHWGEVHSVPPLGWLSHEGAASSRPLNAFQARLADRRDWFRNSSHSFQMPNHPVFSSFRKAAHTAAITGSSIAKARRLCCCE